MTSTDRKANVYAIDLFLHILDIFKPPDKDFTEFKDMFRRILDPLITKLNTGQISISDELYKRLDGLDEMPMVQYISRKDEQILSQLKIIKMIVKLKYVP